MIERIKKLWLDALRSGEYSQCAGKLANETSFCCLGVLCEVAIKEGLALRKERYLTGIVYYGAEGETKKDDILPDSVVDWSMLGSAVGSYAPMKCLSKDNDTGKTFAEIADIIEKEF